MDASDDISAERHEAGLHGHDRVDVIVLSYARTERELELTRQCVRSLLASSSQPRFNVVVVETSTPAEFEQLAAGGSFGDACRVVHPNRPFNYNEFLQFGYAELGHSDAPYLLIVNNDVVFRPGFVEPLLDALDEFDSVSPWWPGHHEMLFSTDEPFRIGFRTGHELCGWALMFRKRLLSRISFSELFPRDFSFWFQDNYYAFQLERLGCRHTLVRDSEVIHLFQQSHTLLEPAERERMTSGALEVYCAKTGLPAPVRPSGGQPAVLGNHFLAVTADVGNIGPAFVDLIEETARKAYESGSGFVGFFDNGLRSDSERRSTLQAWCRDASLAFASPAAVPGDLATGARHSVPALSASTGPIGDRGKSGDGVPGVSPALTVAILALPGRARSFLVALAQALELQARGKPVELLVLMDDKTWSVGHKRNTLLQEARGSFIAFVDDDDAVSEDYVDTLLHAIDAHPQVDCITFDSWVTFDGADGKPTWFGVEYVDADQADGYLRQPNHLCCYRTSLVRGVPFPDISFQEDFQWAKVAARKVRCQVRLRKTLYFYRFSTGTTEACAHLRSAPDRPLLPAAEGGAASQGSIRTEDRAEALPIYGFLHVALVNRWRDILEEQLAKMKASGLYARASRILIGAVGGDPSDLEGLDDKLQVAYHSPDLGVAEFPTLQFLHRFSQRTDCLVFYAHTKGVVHDTESVRDWRQLMEHFVVSQHQRCIDALADHDVSGVNWHRTPSPHFSGNFWWARSDYLRTLPDPLALADEPDWRQFGRHVAELWIGFRPDVRAASLHESGVDHYYLSYPRSKYSSIREVPLTSAFHDGSAWRGLENLFQPLLDAVGPIRLCVEIGVDFGYSLFALAAALPDATILGIDPYAGLSKAEAAQQNRSPALCGTAESEAWVQAHGKHFPNACLWKGTSEEAARRFWGRIDLLHIDSMHDYEDVVRDFALWEPHVRPGGCVLFHDTVSFPDGVGRFFGELPGRKAHISRFAGLGAWYKDGGSEVQKHGHR